MKIKQQAQKLPSQIKRIGLYLGIESNKAKTQRVVNHLKDMNKENPNASLACFGVSPERLNNIKSWKELPKDVVEIHDEVYKEPSLIKSLLGPYVDFVYKL